MPEGDSIWLSAQKLRPVLDGEVITFADARQPAIADGLAGSTCGPLETIGKHLLLTFGGGQLQGPVMLRVHLGMKGRWSVSDAGGRRPGNFDRLGLLLETDRGRAALTYPLQLDRFRARDRGRQAALTHLGPDLLDDSFSPERQLSARRHGRTRRARPTSPSTKSCWTSRSPAASATSTSRRRSSSKRPTPSRSSWTPTSTTWSGCTPALRG